MIKDSQIAAASTANFCKLFQIFLVTSPLTSQQVWNTNLLQNHSFSNMSENFLFELSRTEVTSSIMLDRIRILVSNWLSSRIAQQCFLTAHQFLLEVNAVDSIFLYKMPQNTRV